MFESSPTPPSAKELSKWLGIPAPEPMIAFFQFLHEEAAQQKRLLEEVFIDLTDLYIGSREDRYPGTPAELMPFGRPGVDGIHFGYLVHDLELGPDFPVGYRCPMDSEGVLLVGSDTRDALELMMSKRLKRAEDDEEGAALRKLVERAAKALNIKPSVDRVERAFGWGFGPVGDGLPGVTLKLPEGWNHAMTADGLGVAAKKGFFDPDQEITRAKDELSDDEEFIDLAEEALEAGHPATALCHLRNAAWFDGDLGELLDPMVRVYKKLGRKFLAQEFKKLCEKEG